MDYVEWGSQGDYYFDIRSQSEFGMSVLSASFSPLYGKVEMEKC